MVASLARPNGEYVARCSCRRDFRAPEERDAVIKHRAHVEEMVGLEEFEHTLVALLWPGDEEELDGD